MEIDYTTNTREAKGVCPICCLEEWAVDYVIGLFVEGAKTWKHFWREAKKDFEEGIIAQFHGCRGTGTRCSMEGLHEFHNPFQAFG